MLLPVSAFLLCPASGERKGNGKRNETCRGRALLCRHDRPRAARRRGRAAAARTRPRRSSSDLARRRTVPPVRRRRAAARRRSPRTATASVTWRRQLPPAGHRRSRLEAVATEMVRAGTSRDHRRRADSARAFARARASSPGARAVHRSRAPTSSADVSGADGSRRVYGGYGPSGRQDAPVVRVQGIEAALHASRSYAPGEAAELAPRDRRDDRCACRCSRTGRRAGRASRTSGRTGSR